MIKKFAAFLALFFVLLMPMPSFAHEAYVLTKEQFYQGLAINTKNPLAGLLDPNYINVSIIITIVIMAIYASYLLLATTSFASKLDKTLKRAKVFGPLIIRLAISASFFFAAEANSVLGPELSLDNLTYGIVIKLILYVISLMVFFGIFVEVAALIGLFVFVYLTSYYNLYMLTYMNYFGELIVLFLFGSRMLSFDNYFFGKKLWFKKMEKFKELEVPIVRILYGVALIYAGVSIKFLHENLSILVYDEYHLKDFFHASASFIASGAGLSEVLIGVFILIGFSQRLTVFISLIFISLSLLYFREMLWPHLMLYGISLSLIINAGDKFTLDRYLIPFVKKTLKKVFKT